MLNASMRLDAESLSFGEQEDGKQQAIVDVLGIAVDDRGRFASFKQRLDIPREVVLAKDGRFIKWGAGVVTATGSLSSASRRQGS